MAKPHAKPAPEEFKKHGDPLESMKKNDSQTTSSRIDPVPAPDNGGHPHSAAAHLGDAHAHTKPLGNPHPSAAPGALRQPPMEISRAGKKHR